MKFTCFYRADDGSRKSMTILALNRTVAYKYAKDTGLNVIEICTNEFPKYKIKNNRKTQPISRHKGDVKVVSNNEDDKEVKKYKSREHSFIVGFLFGPLGFILSFLIWKECGAKYSLYGLGMALVSYILSSLFGVLGFIISIILAVIVERSCIPKPGNDEFKWKDL